MRINEMKQYAIIDWYDEDEQGNVTREGNEIVGFESVEEMYSALSLALRNHSGGFIRPATDIETSIARRDNR
jgi:hypothetical protein